MMLRRKQTFAALGLLTVVLAFSAPTANAKPSEYQAVIKHLKTKYQAKKVGVPFMWLARFAVRIVRPAGVKSFNVTLLKDLRFSAEAVDGEMQRALREMFPPDWSSILRVRNRDGQHVYMYMREDGKNVKIHLVTIDKTEAAVIRATFSPERLGDFINDPKIFGISLKGDDKQEDQQKQVAPPADK
jgi:hypothetical protein